MIKEKVFNPELAPNSQVILDSVSDLIIAFDKEFNIAYYNKAFKTTFEIYVNEPFDSEKPLNSYLGLSRFRDLESKFNDWTKRAFNGKHVKESIDYKIIGKQISYAIEIIPFIKNNKVKYIQFTAREITLKKNYEELIKNSRPKSESKKQPSESDLEKEKIQKERDDALNLLMENAERLQIIFDGSNDGFWDWNISNNQLFYSKQYYEILGFRVGELKSDFNTWEGRIHPDDVNTVLENLHKHLEGKSDYYEAEYRILTKSNQWKWILDKGKVAIRDENGNPQRIAGTISDIDERKLTERKLKESQEQFFRLAENLPVMVWVVDKKFKPTFVNKLAKEFIGKKSGSNNLKEFVHKDDYDFFSKILKTSIKTKRSQDCEIRIKNFDNSFHWVLTNIVPMFNEDDRFNGFIGAGLDITERKEIETRLLESETQFTEITNVIGDGIFMVDSNFKLKFANPEFTNLLGYKENEIVEQNMHNLLHNHDENDPSICSIEKIFKNGETLRVPEDYFRNSFGEFVPVSYVASPIKRNDEIIGCVVAFHDIRERIEAQNEMNRFVEELQFNKELMEENAIELVRLNEKLGESEAELQELNANKDKFFSIISHDLRSPFTSIIGFAEVILEDIDTLDKEEIKEFATSIYKSSKNIQNLLENLLQWSRVQTGRIEFNPIKFEINHLVSDIVALYQVNAARKKITLINEVDTNLEIKADKFMIDTVLRNLVSNAIKFTPQGGQISVHSNYNADSQTLELSVEDNGVGMGEEILNKLFKIDEHVTTKGTEKEKGTGLGLILCKEFIEKHGGKIWAQSKIGEGSKFKFTIPHKI